MSDKCCGEKSDRPNQYSPAMQSQSGLIKEVKTEIEDVAPDIIQGDTDEEVIMSVEKNDIPPPPVIPSPLAPISPTNSICDPTIMDDHQRRVGDQTSPGRRHNARKRNSPDFFVPTPFGPSLRLHGQGLRRGPGRPPKQRLDDLFTETEVWRPNWEDDNLRKLSDEDKEWLERPFTFEEVERVINSFDGDKTPGPDGFNLHFFQKCWNTVKDDVWNVVDAFQRKGTFDRSINSTFIALIPKKKGTVEIKDFRPISLLGSVYKILAKLLAERLKLVVDNLISHH
ncbi:hypothetical protein MTR67_037273 [Solanum verrucosum]|uniref:Uncharacterized protein n=1 Tax=Solanum verrucosum TaxID=315347 RepID=A0AAF0UDK7_SOLVR|nr:hypothetical protein MTR67_037273 [Solanum verrucosum]